MAKQKTQEDNTETELQTNGTEPDPTTQEGDQEQTEGDDTQASDGFEWEEALPNSGGGSGQSSKYDWSAFPEPKDGRFPTKTYMGLKGPKPIYNSIKKFQAKLSEAGKAYPEFTCRVVKEGTGKDAKVVGVKVQRVK